MPGWNVNPVGPSDEPTESAVAIFGKPVTLADINRHFPSPLDKE